MLILTGLHSDTPKHHGKPASAATTTPTTPSGDHAPPPPTTTTTSTTAPPSVSAPTAATAHAATYTVAAPTYSLTIAATTGECWVDVTNTATGAVLFTTTLQSGQSHAIAATGPVTVIAGAPGGVQRHRQRRAGDAAARQPGAVHPQLPDGVTATSTA